MATPVEIDAMRRAITLSAFGLGTTSPNPPVGCVILDERGNLVGEGYHERKGEPHAEVQALAAAGSSAADGSAIVTLEPCNHHGRTPPCRQALLDAHISRVVIALIDPTSRGEGGAAILRSAGVDVEVGALADEARLVLGPWLASLQIGRPMLTWAYSLGSDSRVRPAPENIIDFLLLRHSIDAVIHAGGQVDEAVPDSHGAGILQLASPPLSAGPQAVLQSLYEGGVRSLLLNSERELADPFLAAGFVDQVIVYVANEGPSRRPVAISDAVWTLMPPGFIMTGVRKVAGWLRVEGRRHGSGLKAPR